MRFTSVSVADRAWPLLLSHWFGGPPVNRALSIGATILVLSYAVFALVACGGGGKKTGRPPCYGTYYGQGICIPPGIYTLGGTVSGLAGSGLVLTDIGAETFVGGNVVPVAISANGSFVFSTKYFDGEPYDVVVGAEPANPSQTCTVANGRGTVGSGNVADIVVICTTGVANARLNGTYTAVHYDHPGESGGLWTVTFDGAGKFSGTDTTITTYYPGGSSGAISGTYTLAADGTLNISPDGGITVTGGLSADGNTLVISQTTPGVPPEVLIGIKQGPANFSNANLSGTYTAAHFRSPGFPNTIDEGGLWIVTFDGASNFSGTDTLNNHGTASKVALSGTYTVATDGTLSISPNGGSTITGALSADGNTWVTSQTTKGDWPEILVGIKQGPTSLSNANLNGRSTTVYYTNTGYDSSNDDGGLWDVTFDGAGNFNGADTVNTPLATLSTPVSGTYAVAADGALSLSPIGGSTVAGGLSADGTTWVAGQTTPGQPPSIYVGVLRVPP